MIPYSLLIRHQVVRYDSTQNPRCAGTSFLQVFPLYLPYSKPNEFLSYLQAIIHVHILIIPARYQTNSLAFRVIIPCQDILPIPKEICTSLRQGRIPE